MDEGISNNRDRQAALLMFKKIKRWRVRDWVLVNLAITIVLGFCFLRISSPPPAISSETYDRIEMGMAWQDVHGIVRAMPGGYGAIFDPRQVKHNVSTKPALRYDRWWSADGILDVGYDADGMVCEKKLTLSDIDPPTHPERWTWSKRQRNRQIPGSKLSIFFIHF
jgi:hypothetical protein